jgi:crotonobetainyl-CoA:carnitine CoA-transferase CaiB-like acyl-CoA transferase
VIPCAVGLAVEPRQAQRVLDLTDDADRAVPGARRRADVVIRLRPRRRAKLGADRHAAAANPRLVHCSITGYGTPAGARNLGLGALVAARTGHQWESRGTLGGTIARLAGVEGMMPGLEAPEGCWVGAERAGPLFSGIPWPSFAPAYLATLAISAAIRAREITGRGQHVHTSLFQGALCSTLGGWQRVDHPDAPNFQTWVTDPRAPKGFFRCKDGRWTHHWVPLPSFVLGVAERSSGDHAGRPAAGPGRHRHASRRHGVAVPHAAHGRGGRGVPSDGGWRSPRRYCRSSRCDRSKRTVRSPLPRRRVRDRGR